MTRVMRMAALVFLAASRLAAGAVVDPLSANAIVARDHNPIQTVLVHGGADVEIQVACNLIHNQAAKVKAAMSNTRLRPELATTPITISLEGPARPAEEWKICENAHLRVLPADDSHFNPNMPPPPVIVTVTLGKMTSTRRTAVVTVTPRGTWIMGRGGYTYSIYGATPSPYRSTATVTVTPPGTWVRGRGGYTYSLFPPTTSAAMETATPDAEAPPESNEPTSSIETTQKPLPHTSITVSGGGTTQYVTWDLEQYSSWVTAAAAASKSTFGGSVGTAGPRITPPPQKRAVDYQIEPPPIPPWREPVTITVTRTSKTKGWPRPWPWYGRTSSEITANPTPISQPKPSQSSESDGGWPTLVWTRPTLTVELTAPFPFPILTHPDHDDEVKETAKGGRSENPTLKLSGAVSGSAVVVSVPWQASQMEPISTPVQTYGVSSIFPLTTITTVATIVTGLDAEPVTKTVTSALTSKDTTTFTYFYGNSPITSTMTQTKISKQTVVSVYSPVVVSPLATVRPNSDGEDYRQTPEAYTVVVVQTTNLGGERSMITQIQGGMSQFVGGSYATFTGLPEGWGSQLLSYTKSLPKATTIRQGNGEPVSPVESRPTHSNRPPTFAPNDWTTFRTSPRPHRTDYGPAPIVTYTSLDGYTPLYEAPDAQPTFYQPTFYQPTFYTPTPQLSTEETILQPQSSEALIPDEENMWTSRTIESPPLPTDPLAGLDETAVVEGLQILGGLIQVGQLLDSLTAAAPQQAESERR